MVPSPAAIDLMTRITATPEAAATQTSVTARLVQFMRTWQTRGVPPDVLHETTRLVINQLKASVGATTSPAVRILEEWAVESGQHGTSPILWFGSRATAEYASVVNGALFEVLDFNDTYIPCFMHAVSGVLPAALAVAVGGGHTGHQFLTALAIGIEVELACATLLMPSGYYRGFVAGGITAGIGAASACCVLSGLDAVAAQNALGIAMNCGIGTYQAAGFMSFSYVMGHAARGGLVAYDLARRGLDAPAAAFEGDKGMLSSYSNESPGRIAAVLDTLGEDWRIKHQSYKTVPTETITHGPIECVMQVLAQARGRTVQRMRFGVEAIVVKIADERMQRFGVPNSELTAKFDLRFCAAAAWTRGRFTLAEMSPAAYTDPQILDLRSRIELVADPSFATFNGAALEVEFTDGTRESARVADFRGTPQNPLTDDELSALFAAAAADRLPAGKISAILDAAWNLPRAERLDPLIGLLTLATPHDRKG
jgi:2-methylcitrate dehydratase PrpD